MKSVGDSGVGVSGSTYCERLLQKYVVKSNFVKSIYLWETICTLRPGFNSVCYLLAPGLSMSQITEPDFFSPMLNVRSQALE